MLHFHHLNACTMPWSDGYLACSPELTDPVHGLWCQINCDTHHTIKHRLWSRSQGTCVFGHGAGAWCPHITEEGLHSVVGWVLSHQLMGHARAYLMWLVMTQRCGEHTIANKRWNEWNGEASASLLWLWARECPGSLSPEHLRTGGREDESRTSRARWDMWAAEPLPSSNLE